jgi:hypothetical protein
MKRVRREETERLEKMVHMSTNLYSQPVVTPGKAGEWVRVDSSHHRRARGGRKYPGTNQIPPSAQVDQLNHPLGHPTFHRPFQENSACLASHTFPVTARSSYIHLSPSTIHHHQPLIHLHSTQKSSQWPPPCAWLPPRWPRWPLRAPSRSLARP